MGRASAELDKAPERLAVVRSPSALVSVQAFRRSDFVAPTFATALPLTPLYDLERVPVAGPRLPTDLRVLAAAWGRLADAPAHGSDVLADALLVLLSTVPAAAHHALPAPCVETPPASRRPTAAHPRAYRGTKHTPPKPGRAMRQDLRAQLCSIPSTRAILSSLWPSRMAALRRVRQLGLDGAGLRRLAACAEPPADPYVAVWHDGIPANPRLPRAFVEWVLPSMRGAPWPRVRRAAALYERLDLADDQALSTLAARLVHAAPEHALMWLGVLDGQPAERRASFLALAIQTGAVQDDPSLIPSALLLDLAHAPATMYACWTYRVLERIHQGANPQYLAAGVRFALEYAPDKTLYRVYDAPDFDDRTAERLVRLLPADWAGDELIGLWETCGAVPGFPACVGDTNWSGFTAPQRRYLLRFFMDMRWDQDGAVEARRWRAIAECLPTLTRRVAEIPAAYTDQYLNDVGVALSSLRTTPEVRAQLPLVLELLARVNRPPFDPDGNAAKPLANLLGLPSAQWRQVLAAPEAAFLALDKACRRSNAATLIAWGLSSLVAGLPQLVSDSFGTATGALIRTARHLGVLSWPARVRLVSHCAKLPIFEESLEQRPPAEIVSTLDAAGAVEAAATVPRALRDHLVARRRLSPGQIERHLAHVRAALPSARLAVLRAAVDLQLAGAIGSREADRDALAALALLQDAAKNKRGLRRFLRAYQNGDPDHLLRHPATRDWSRRHGRIDIELWTRGLERPVLLETGEELCIRLEQDPLEVLKMGTYVGSCLGLGGGLSYSAAAALLDVNKQVLYARDARGTVVARQLVAISDDDRLVSFAVYPQSASAALQRAFDQYDSDLAAALRVSRAETSEPYALELVLAHEWWDDGAWDPDDSTTWR